MAADVVLHYISAVVIGAKTIQQLEDSMGAGKGWELTDEQVYN